MSFPVPLVTLRQPKAQLSAKELGAAFGVTTVTIHTWAATGWLPRPVVNYYDRLLVKTRTELTQYVVAPRAFWRVRDLVRCHLW